MTAGRNILLVGRAGYINDQSLQQALGQDVYAISRVAMAAAANDWMETHGLPNFLLIEVDETWSEDMKFGRALYESTGIPIIVICQDTISKEEAVEALHYADDLVRRQFATSDELAMRIRRVLSRVVNFSYATGPILKITDWLSARLVDHQVIVDGETRRLTPTENALLSTLLLHRGRVVDAGTLLERVWLIEAGTKDRNALRVHIHRLRQKIERDPDHPTLLQTERGIGYVFSEV